MVNKTIIGTLIDIIWRTTFHLTLGVNLLTY